MLKSSEQRFEESYIPVTESGCHLWLMSLDRTGYGQIMVKGKLVMAHRYSYERRMGAIPEGLELDHVCRVRCCVNPDHLRAVTHKENILSGASPSAIHARKTHCIHGHPFSGENLSLAKDGERICRTCNKNRSRAWYLAHRTNGNGEQP